MKRNQEKNKLTIIDTAGQWTPILLGDYNTSEQAGIGKALLKKYPKAGQVAFIDSLNSARMMGGELSINGSIAVGYALLNKLGKKTTCFQLLKPKLAITATLSEKEQKLKATFNQTIIEEIQDNKVYLNGISYQLIEKIPQNKKLSTSEKDLLTEISTNNSAAGIIFYSKNKIWPVVYVKATNTLAWETACGSASLSLFLVKGFERIIQPSGKIITIQQRNDTLSISSPVKEIKI